MMVRFLNFDIVKVFIGDCYIILNGIGCESAAVRCVCEAHSI